MYRLYPSSGQSAEPERPPAPAPVRTAVKLMYAGAAVWTVMLIGALVLIIVGSKAVHATLNGHTLHGKSVPVTVAVVSGLIVIALWLWMARANGQGRNWARILSTVLFGLATLQLISQAISRQPVTHAGAGLIVLGVIVPVLGWLVGLAAVWLLWRRDSSAFFKPQAFPHAGRGAQPSSRTESSSRLPRQV